MPRLGGDTSHLLAPSGAGLLAYDHHYLTPFLGVHLERCFADYVCYWALTTGRSGTGTLAALLDSVWGLSATHETYPALHYEGRLAFEGRWLVGRAATRLLHVARGQLIHAAIKDRKIYCETSLLLTHLAPQLREAFVDSRFIHLVRRPRDFVCSALARNWYNRDTDQGYWWPESPYEGDRVRSLLWYWDQVHSRALTLERAWGPRYVRRLYFEELIQGTDTFEELLTWMGSDRDIVGRNRGLYASVLSRRLNRSQGRADWDPAWDDALDEIAGGTYGEIYDPAHGRDGSGAAAGPEASRHGDESPRLEAARP